MEPALAIEVNSDPVPANEESGSKVIILAVMAGGGLVTSAWIGAIFYGVGKLLLWVLS
jgi:hypothetical protein